MGNWWRWLGGKVARTTFPRTTIRGGLNQSAQLHVEELENRCVPARLGTPLNDPDDTIAEAINVGTITNKRSVRRSASLGFATDVDMYRFSVAAGATVEFIVQARAPATDPYLRLFDRRGNELAFNDDGPIPNQPPGFSPYLKYQFSTAGTYYIGISGYPNMNYDPIQGTGDVEGSTGPYSLIIKLVPPEGGGGGGRRGRWGWRRWRQWRWRWRWDARQSVQYHFATRERSHRFAMAGFPAGRPTLGANHRRRCAGCRLPGPAGGRHPY
jgi:hypothetical protein